MNAAAERHLTALTVYRQEAPRTFALNTTRDALIRESYRHGVSVEDIANALGLAPHVVRTIVVGVTR